MERLNLYPHNNDSSKRIIDAFNNGENVVGIVHATGTGKTFNALSLCLENKDKKIVYLVPSKAVSEHIKKVIESNPNLSLERDFPNLEFRTYQSLCNLSTKELENINADYLILDEFHHIGAPIWGDRVNTIIETHPNIKVFGMTAYTVRDRGTAYERDMANPEGKELFSNKIVSTYDLPDAMIDGVLPLPIYRSAYTQLQGMAQELEERVLNGNVSKEEKERYLELLDAVKRRIAEAPSIKDVIIRNLKKDGKYIYFCPPGATEGVNDIETIKKEVLGWLKDFVNEEDIVFYQTTSELGEIGIVNRECFYNDTDLEGKSTDGKLRIMFAINQYNEGVHAPNIDGVILGRGTSSDIVYFEQIGRALSVRGNTYEEFNKYMEYSIYELREIVQNRNIDTSKLQTKEEIIEKLIAPVIIDLANNISFIKELENNLKDRIKQVTETKTNQERRIRLIPEVSFDIEVLNEELFEVLVDLQNRLGHSTWEEMYELAKEYFQENNHLDIPRGYKVQTLNGKVLDLGNWIIKQRTNYSEGKLTDEKIKKLESIAIKWELFEEKWEEMYSFAQKYYFEHHHLDIPDNYKVQTSTGKIVSLGNWIGTQRANYSKGKLTTEKIQKLESIAIKWDVYEEQWNEMYNFAREYYLKNHHLSIPENYKVQTTMGKIFDLGIWIGTQRANYRKGKLLEEKIRKLESIEIKWDVYEEQWLTNFELAKKYYEEHNNLDISQKYNVQTSTGEIVIMSI